MGDNNDSDSGFCDYDFQESERCYCSTCNNPPCGYCESRATCENCGGRVASSDLQEYQKSILVKGFLETVTVIVCSECGLSMEV